jgi:hypothetical protein
VAWKKELDKVTDPKLVYPLLTPFSQIDVTSEQILFRKLKSDNSWHTVGDAWRAALVPEGVVLVETATNSKYMCERALKNAIVLWPMHAPELGL